MKLTIARLRVLLKAAPTWLTAAAVIVATLRDTIAEQFPGVAEDVAAVAAPVLAVITAALLIVRRVAPVLPEERGLLPAGGTPGDA